MVRFRPVLASPNSHSPRFRSLLSSIAFATSVASACACLVVSPAFADDTAKAKITFQEGLALEGTSDFGGALAKFEAVAKVKRTPQVAFHIAFCQERVGRMLEALAVYKTTLAEATAGAADPKLQQVKTATEEAIAVLEKKIPTVTVKAPKSPAPEITLDGKKLEALDAPQRVDPGVHTVAAKAEGKEPFSAKIDAPEGTQRTVEIKWKETAKVAVVEEPEAPRPAPPVEPPSSSKLPYVVGGIGVASLVTSGIFFYIRSSAQSDLEDKCQGTLCPESARASGDRGKLATTVTNVTLAVGVVGVGAGITLYALDRKSAPDKAAVAAPRLRAGVSVLPWQGAGASVATLSGAF